MSAGPGRPTDRLSGELMKGLADEVRPVWDQEARAYFRPGFRFKESLMSRGVPERRQYRRECFALYSKRLT